jgi:nuclear pore complex protein Nup155
MSRKAKDEQDPDTKNRLLRESLRLFEETAGSLTMDNLTDTISEYRSLNYYTGAVQLALTVARESDRGNLAMQYLAEPPTVLNESAEIYLKRLDCYKLVFQVLEDLEAIHGQAPEMIDGVPSPAIRIRNETWGLIYSSDDELFHYQLYDWLFAQGGARADRLLEVDSPHVLGYLQYRGTESIDHCELLWQYHARRGNYFEAATVLHELAQSDFQLSLEKRLEFFSRARSLCSSHGAVGTRQRMNKLSQAIQEELDVAVIQDDLLKRLREDPRLSQEKKLNLERKLGSKLFNLSVVGQFFFLFLLSCI